MEQAALDYTTVLQEAISVAVPRIEPRKKQSIRRWWSKELDHMTQTVKALKDRAQKTPANVEMTAEASLARKTTETRCEQPNRAISCSNCKQ